MSAHINLPTTTGYIKVYPNNPVMTAMQRVKSSVEHTIRMVEAAARAYPGEPLHLQRDNRLAIFILAIDILEKVAKDHAAVKLGNTIIWRARVDRVPADEVAQMLHRYLVTL